MSDLGIVIDKMAVRDILVRLQGGHPSFSPGPLGLEQAVNAIGRLQRPPANIHEAALAVTCPYCGYTPGNPCHRSGEVVTPHPSRVAAAFS